MLSRILKKNKQIEVNNVITKIKNTLEDINHKINEIEEQISDMVDRVVKITSPTGKKKERKEKE